MEEKTAKPGKTVKQAILNEIGHIPEDGRVYFFTDGTWSLFELIDFALDYIPPSHVTLSSFSLSEDSIRHLLHLKETGKILSLTGLFDPSLRKTKTPLLYFADEIFDRIALSPNHSKIILFENTTKPLTIMASANLGRNRRIEAGLVDTDTEVFDFFFDKLSEAFSMAQPI